MNDPNDFPTENNEQHLNMEEDTGFDAEEILEEIVEEAPGIIRGIVDTHPLTAGLGALALGFVLGRSRQILSMGFSLAMDALQPLAVTAIQDYLANQIGDVDDILNSEE